jgi:phosphoribosyl 1,2-cyclic phosphodiesterase
VLTCEGGCPIVLDAGTGLRVWGETTDPAVTRTAAVLITHAHLDHIQGLPFFSPLFHAGSSLDLYGPPQTRGSFEKAVTRVFQPPLHPVRPSEVLGDLWFHEVGDEALLIGDAVVIGRPIRHLGPTVGYRVEHHGSSVAYLSDHQAPSDLWSIEPSVLELAAGVDLLIHDAQYTPADWVAKSNWGHSLVAYALRVANAAGARRLALFHHDPSRTDDALDRLLAEAQCMPQDGDRCEILAAREGLILELAERPLPT